MKNISLAILAMSLIFISCSENTGVKKAFSKYGHKEGVTSISVPGFVIHLAAAIGDIDEKEKELLRSIDQVKVLAVGNENYLNSEVNLHKEFYNLINETGDFEELLAVANEDENVTIFGKSQKEDVFSELVILVGGEDNALIYLKGRIQPDMFDRYINLSNPKNFLSLNL